MTGWKSLSHSVAGLSPKLYRGLDLRSGLEGRASPVGVWENPWCPFEPSPGHADPSQNDTCLFPSLGKGPGEMTILPAQSLSQTQPVHSSSVEQVLDPFFTLPPLFSLTGLTPTGCIDHSLCRLVSCSVWPMVRAWKARRRESQALQAPPPTSASVGIFSSCVFSFMAPTPA